MIPACGGIAVFDGDGGGGTSATTTTTTDTITSVQNCPDYPDAYGDYPDDLCGQGLSMQCGTIPTSCAGQPSEPVCACDGVAYTSACAANMNGLDVSVLELCAAPEGTFPCGQYFCTFGSEYCEVRETEGSSPDTYTCISLPTWCPSDPSCSCLTGEPCGGICQETTPNRLVLICAS